MKVGEKILKLTVLTTFLFIFTFIPTSDAHILVIGDSLGDYPLTYSETSSLSHALKLNGYDVLELYGNATSKNILKGM